MIRDTPDPPDWCTGPYARAAWQNGYRAVIARMEWGEGFSGMLAQMAMFAQAYIRDIHENRPAPEMAERRECLRGLLADYLLIAPDIDAPELDAAIARLCDVPLLQ
jgi:hypothetical protein